jgi:hypothetical protein
VTLLEDLLSPAQYEAWRACRAPGEMPVRMFARETERSEGTVGNHLRRAGDKLAEAADDFAALAEPVDFLEERDARSTSWERAAPLAPATEIRQLNRHTWLLQLPDGSPHVTVLLRRQGAYRGWCDCNGWEYRDDATSPCAHLCTLRQGAFAHVETEEGERLQVADASTSREPVTDGGEIVKPPAGADGREFGRPEGQL